MPIYFVNNGCTFSHRRTNVKRFDKLRDARAYIDELRAREARGMCPVWELVRVDDETVKVLDNGDFSTEKPKHKYSDAMEKYLREVEHGG